MTPQKLQRKKFSFFKFLNKMGNIFMIKKSKKLIKKIKKKKKNICKNTYLINLKTGCKAKEE